jgi:thiol:disulfide interchange protein
LNNESKNDLPCLPNVLTVPDSIESNDSNNEALTNNKIKNSVSAKKANIQKITRLVQNESNGDNLLKASCKTLSQELSLGKKARSQDHLRNSNENLTAGLLTVLAVVMAILILGLFIALRSAFAPEIPPIINILAAIIIIAILIKVLRKIHHYDAD